MNATKVATTIQRDGELHLTHLPCRKGDRVEAIILVLEKSTVEDHAEALRRFNEHADLVSFRSERPYPSRDELHERH